MRSSRSFWVLCAALWVLLLAGGWHTLLRHEFTPGAGGDTPSTWPTESALPRDRERPTLVLFAHRNCPCTRTTLGELEQILTPCSDRVRAVVVLLTPAGGRVDRVGRAIEAMARSLPETEVVADPVGREARRFGVRTSGHAVLYSAEGRLRFSGGITDARGHAGDSEGGRALLAWLQNDTTERRTAPVYGCSLFANDGDEEMEDESWNR
jgi:hypothetical protein